MEQTLTAAESVAWFFKGMGIITVFVLIKLAFSFARRGMGEFID